MGTVCKKWTQEDDNFLIENYSKKTALEIGTALNRTRSAVKNRVSTLGLILPEDIRIQKCSQGFFKKGDEPWTKGKKQSDYMTVEAIEKTKKTRFISGQTPHNIKQNGFISIRRDVDGRLYKWIRITKNKWVHLHRYVWQNAFGQVPHSMIITFIDRNTMNVELNNLELISNKELLRRNWEKGFSVLRLIWEKKRIKKNNEKREKLRNPNKDKVARYGSMKIVTDNSFYKSVSDNFQNLFAYSMSLVKNEEAAQDLIHEMIANGFEDKETSFADLKNLLIQTYKIGRKGEWKLSHNENALNYKTISPASESTDILQEIKRAINSLDQPFRDIAQAIYIDESTAEEAASELQMEVEFIESKLPFINSQLQTKLMHLKN